MEKAKRAMLIVFALAAGAFLLIGGLFSVISGTVADLATAPPPVPAADRVAFWYPYIAGATRGLDPVQLVDSILSMSSQGNVAKDSSDSKNIGLMWIPKADGQNLEDPANNINTGVSILGPYTGGKYQGYIDSYFRSIGQSPTPKTKTVYDIKGNPHKVPVYPDYTKAIFDVWVGNSDTTGASDTYAVDGADATVLAIAQGPDGTSTTSSLSTQDKPITWPTIRLPDVVQPALPANAKVLPKWAQEVTWGQAFYGPADPSSGNYLLYPGMYVYQIDVHAKSKDVKQVTIPFQAVWTTPHPKGPPTVYAQAEKSITIDFNSSSSSGGGGGGGGGGSTVYTSPKALQYKPVDPNVIIAYLDQFDSALANNSDVTTIITAAQDHGLNPLLLFAITGQEQDFDDQNNDSPVNVYRIEQNPFNVGGSWQDTDYTLAVSSDICANFLAERLSEAPPSGGNAVQWINHPANPNGGLYASDNGQPTPGWWEGVNYFFNQMDGLPNVYASQSGDKGTGASPGGNPGTSATGNNSGNNGTAGSPGF